LVNDFRIGFLLSGHIEHKGLMRLFILGLFKIYILSAHRLTYLEVAVKGLVML